MEKVKCFGSLADSDWCAKAEFKDVVSVSYDTTQHDTTAKYKIMVQVEPPEIHDCTLEIIENADKFDLILSWNPEILNSCPNSEKFLFGTCWIDMNTFNPNKTNEISFITSGKNWSKAKGHSLRHTIFHMLQPNYNGFSVNKIMTPPRIPNKDVMFKNAKYSIIVENISRYDWITEKFIDCIATKTIPIYYGCPNIGDYFNDHGVLSFTTIDELNTILTKLTPEFYDSMLDVLEENYQKSLQYHDFHKRIDGVISKIVNNV